MPSHDYPPPDDQDPMAALKEKIAAHTSKLPLGKIILFLLIVWCIWTGFYEVPAESVAVVQRFGAYHTTAQPGLCFKLPFGIDEVTLVPIQRQLKMEFGFTETQEANNTDQASLEPDAEHQMVTGDLNAASVEWVVQYKITDPEAYLFNIRDPGPTLRAASEAVMRDVVGDRTVDELLTIGRSQIESASRDKLRDLVKLYDFGVTINNVQLRDVNPPLQVRGSFNEVNQAQQEQKSAINKAQGEYNKAVPEARGVADQKIQEAEGYALKRVNEAEGDVSRFNALFIEYQKAPAVTRERLYLETMTKVLPLLGRKILLDENAKGVLPLLQLSESNEPKRK